MNFSSSFHSVKTVEKTTEVSKLVTFKLENDIYGVDIMKTQEILKFTPLRKIPNSPAYFEGMLNLRSQIIPIVNFKRLFNFHCYDLGREKGIIIIKSKEVQFGFVSDKILRVLTYEEKDLRPIQGTTRDIEKYVIGVIRSPENELISVLDIDSILGITGKSYLLGKTDDEYILKSRKEKLAYSSIELDKTLKKFLERIQFPVNQLTYNGVRKYFYKLCLKRDMPPSQLLQHIMNNISRSDLYNNFMVRNQRIMLDNDEDYNCLYNLIFTVIFPRKRELKQNTLTIWNPGCPSGVEAASVVILIHKFIDEAIEDEWKIQVICPVANAEELDRAKECLYTEKQISRINPVHRSEFFKDGEKRQDTYELKDELKEQILFELTQDEVANPRKDVDLIFARNHLSLLDKESVLDQLTLMHNSLSKNGILVLSEVEEIDEWTTPFAVRDINNRKYYVKD